jgi:hypothetical protein
MLLPGAIIETEVKQSSFNPYAPDLTAEYFRCLNSISDTYSGAPIEKATVSMERLLRELTCHLEMTGLMAPRLRVKVNYDGDHGAGRIVIELLDKDLLPIRRREPGYVPQIV